MKRVTTYLMFIVAVAAALASCTDNMLENQPAEPQPATNLTFNPDGTLGVRISMAIPGMTAATRAMSEDPDYESLKLYMLVFEEGSGLKQRVELSHELHKPDSEHNHSELITFDATLEPTEKNTVIHLIATNQPGFYEKIGFGDEDRVITALYTDQNREAYWQRLDLGSNIPGAEFADPQSDDYDPEAGEKADAIAEKMGHVPMVRNFCRVSVALGSGVDNFTVKGLYVLNTVDRGSVAPYVANNDPGKRFVKYYDDTQTAADGSYLGLGYKEVSAQKHLGTLPVGVLLVNKETDPSKITTKSEDEGGNVLPVYIYERPARVNSTERTYVILKGRYTGGDAKGKDTYYKLDLGYIDTDYPVARPIGRFEYYNLLRNFDYRINLTSVASDGYDSFTDAAAGAVFNNFSASVEARNMTSISDGEDMIFVSFTSYVFTQPGEEKVLEAQYRVNIDNNRGGEQHNDYLYYFLEEGDENGDVVASVVPKVNIGGGPTDLQAQNTYTIKGGTPTDMLRQQILYIYRGNRAAPGSTADYGLYRVITFFSHIPWEFKHIDTFPGLWEAVDDIPSWDPSNWSSDKREVGQFKGSPLTLFFELPAGLPQALFPLDFVIESDRQNIQNAYQGNAVVRSVPAKESLFYDESGGKNNPTTTRIQYVKTVTWEDYNGELSDELVGTGSTIVRCRFLTITDLAQDGIGSTDDNNVSTSITTLRVSNYCFDKKVDGKIVYHEDGFERSTKTSDPSPRTWDFSSGIWNELFNEMGTNNRRNYTENNNKTDELIFIDGGARSWTNNTDTYTDAETREEVSFRYVQTANANDRLLHKHTYDTSQERVMHVVVTATDVSGRPAEPSVTATRTSGTGNVTLKKSAEDTSGRYGVYTYDIAIDQNVTGVNLEIRRPSNNTNIRIYKIDFNPRWDEYTSADD